MNSLNSLETFFNTPKLKSLLNDPLPTGPKPRKRSTGLTGAKKTRVNYSSDFETTTTEDDCRVWLWGLVPIDNPDRDHFEWGTDIDSFMERCAAHNSIHYFHNLKFDGRYLIDWLLNHGYIHLTEDLFEPKTFKSLISDMGAFYSITVRWANDHTTEFRDSLKKLPMPVKRVAKAFNLDVAKGEIDYHKPRPIGYQPDEEELDYQFNDVAIIGQAMKTVIENGMKKLTVASDAMHEFKQLNGIEYFEKMFPILSNDMDREIRRAYRGGFTYADERFKGRRLDRDGLVFDVN